MEKTPLSITFLGTGTSQGVPVIGCHCEVCRSADDRDKRLRTSVLLSKGNVNIAIDAGPDFRQQMLRESVEALHAILLTHEHNDHLIGLDEVRAFNYLQRRAMPVYATTGVQQEVKKRFAYVFEENPYPGAPLIELRTLSKAEKFVLEGIEITPVEVLHGELPVLGFRVGDFCYLTDVKTIGEEEMAKVFGCKVLVLNALHHKPHSTHLNLEEALALLEKLKPEQAYLTHMSHHIGLYEQVSKRLPPGVALAYDGLALEVF